MKNGFLTRALPVALVGIGFSASTAFAQFPAVTVIDSEYGGSGCPTSTASIFVSDDLLAVLFEQYTAGSPSGEQHKGCLVEVKLMIPPGFMVAIANIDYDGSAAIPDAPRSRGLFRAAYSWAGVLGRTFARQFEPGESGNWAATHPVPTTWSACGGEVSLSSETSLVVQESWVQLDSVSFSFISRRC